MAEVPDSTRWLPELIDLDFERVSLDNVLRYISEVMPEVSIVVDPDIAASGIDLSTRVVDFKGRAIPLGDVLKAILGADLAYVPKLRYLFVTTMYKMHTNLECKTYALGATCPSPELVSIVQRMVNSVADPYVAPWSDEGGPAAIECSNDMLIVSQTYRGHQRIIELLKQIEDQDEVGQGACESSCESACESMVQMFSAGELTRAWEELRQLIKVAKSYVWIEDAYLNSDVVAMLCENVAEQVPLRVLGPESKPERKSTAWEGAVAYLRRLGTERKENLEVRTTSDVHDRYVYRDGEVWRSSESFKDMAQNRTTKLIPEVNPELLIKEFERRWSAAKQLFPA